MSYFRYNRIVVGSNSFVNAKPEKVLKTVFGYDSFRLLQRDIIDSVLSGRDTMAVMPTGGGKSLCYQVPALIFDGITVVVSPLISLMQDQVANLEAAGIHSIFLNSTLEWEDYKKSTAELVRGEVKIVYVSPEGLATGRLRNLLSDDRIKVSCITIDEAHCVSEWGHDFRPDYMEIPSVRNLFPDAVLLALTATATEQVRKDIVKNLEMRNPAVMVSSFNRENIYLEVRPKRNTLQQLCEYLYEHRDESGIIYCFSRRQVDELTSTLDNLGYSVLNYHAGLSDAVRTKNQNLFISDDVKIMVATVAFGMGIDKPNVRFVVNYDLPKSLAEYYQEIGRAGRDGLPSSALLFFSAGDAHKIRYFFDEASDRKKNEVLLQQMLNYGAGRVCRRKMLLGAFGEKYPSQNGDGAGSVFVPPECCCDICSMGEIPLNDVTIPVQKLLSCIIRTDGRFGTNYVVDVLLGSRQQKILDNGHNMISTWGIGQDLCKDDWLNLVEEMISRGFLEKTGDYHILSITPDGRDLLITREKVFMPLKFKGRSGGSAGASSLAIPKPGSEKPQFVIHKKSKPGPAKPMADDKEGEDIVQLLRKWRKKTADEMNIPPYVIFGDKTLYDIAAKKPRSKPELYNIHGIGEAKVEQFGRFILAAVNEVLAE